MDDSQIHRLRVINRNDFVITDRYDGVPFTFPPNEPVDLSLEAAGHILGYPAERDLMNMHMAKRWGWNRPEHVILDPETRKMKFQLLAERIELSIETYEIRRVAPEGPERIDDTPVSLIEGDELAEARRGWNNLPAASGARD